MRRKTYTIGVKLSDKEQHRTAAGDQAADAPEGKQPYEKPSFRHESAFETMALICGKVDPTQEQCKVNIKHS